MKVFVCRIDCYQCYFSTTEPDAVLPLTHTHNDSHATVEWSGSSDYLVARYIVDVRQYVASGPGKAEPHSITGYPQQLSATQLNHTVQVLSELNFVFSSTIQ